MSATNPTARPRKGLFLLIGLGAGLLACWYAGVRPAMAEVDRIATLFGPASGVAASATARVESGIRSLQGDRDAGKERARELEGEIEALRSQAAAATEERATLVAELETSRAKARRLETELSECKEAIQARVDALAKAQAALEKAEQLCARTAAERDAFEQSMQALQRQIDVGRPILAPIEAGWSGSPSALARKAQSAEVLETLSPLLAKGLHQPLRQTMSEPMPFSLQAIEDAGALDRADSESLYRLWSIVATSANDRADKWPTSWAPPDTTDWLEAWFEAQSAAAIPVLDRAQRYLLELGPILVEMRMLAP